MSMISPPVAAWASPSAAGGASACGSLGASASASVSASVAVGGGLGHRIFRRGCRCGRRAVLGGDLGQHGPHIDGVALDGMDLDHGPAGGRRDLGVDLVGGDLDEDLVGLDGVPLLFVPLQDGALGHRLAHLRQGDLHCGVDRHCSEFRL
jgi:hypothetical protein